MSMHFRLILSSVFFFINRGGCITHNGENRCWQNEDIRIKNQKRGKETWNCSMSYRRHHFKRVQGRKGSAERLGGPWKRLGTDAGSDKYSWPCILFVEPYTAVCEQVFTPFLFHFCRLMWIQTEVDTLNRVRGTVRNISTKPLGSLFISSGGFKANSLAGPESSS